MNKFFLSIYLFFFLGISLYAQSGRDRTWILGYGSGLPWEWNTDRLGGMFLKFTDSTYQIEKFDINGGFVNTVANDDNGDLLFYANGCAIYNKNHEIMENGDDLNPTNPYFEECDRSKNDSYSKSGNILLNVPNKPNEYLLFQFGLNVGYLNYYPLLNQLLISKIDISANNGLGKVMYKNQPFIDSDSLQEQMVATRHGNGRDWWIIVPRGTDRDFWKILLTPQGVQMPMLQKLSPQPVFQKTKGDGADYYFEYELERGFGQSCFSPDGSIFCRVQRGFSEVEIYDFDRCIGNLTLRRTFPMPLKTLYLDDNNQSEFVGCAISPNNRYLYFNNSDNLYQFDLCESNLKKGNFVHIAEWDKFVDSEDPNRGPATDFFQMRNMPNGEICIVTVNTTHYLHVIHEPNKAGKACNFEQRGITLPRFNSLTLNYFPNFNLYDQQGSICDSLGIDDPKHKVWETGNKVKIFPNPTNDWFKIYLPNCKGGSLKIFDVSGRLLREVGLVEDLETYTIDVSEFPAAVYMVSVYTCTGYETVKLVKYE
jgi:hypothetical protein